MEKYKIRKRKKPQNPIMIFIVFAACMLLVTFGYAMFYDDLTIIGTAKFKPQFLEELPEELQVGEVFEMPIEVTTYANSKYTYKNISNWQQGDGTYIYQVSLEITNLEEDFSSGNLEISFEVNDKLFENQSHNNLGIIQADKVLISDNKVTLFFKEINSIVKYGDKINILAYLTYSDEQVDGISIQDVILNGKMLIEDTESIIDKIVTETDLKNEVNTQNILSNQVGNNTVLDTNTVENEVLNEQIKTPEKENKSQETQNVI